MATTVSSTTASTATTQSTTAVNPESVLGKDDFLKLLLTELQYQDPTSPMDSDKILQQTSQLATLETQQNANKVMEELSKSFKSSLNFSSISAIGKTAILSDKVSLEEGKSVKFPLDFTEAAQGGTITIKNSRGDTVKTISIKEQKAGVHTFEWNGTDDKGNALKAGAYAVSASYVNPDGKSLETSVGTYKIESISFEDGVAYAKLGGQYIPFENILEVTQTSSAS